MQGESGAMQVMSGGQIKCHARSQQVINRQENSVLGWDGYPQNGTGAPQQQPLDDFPHCIDRVIPSPTPEALACAACNCSQCLERCTVPRLRYTWYREVMRDEWCRNDHDGGPCAEYDDRVEQSLRECLSRLVHTPEVSKPPAARGSRDCASLLRPFTVAMRVSWCGCRGSGRCRRAYGHASAAAEGWCVRRRGWWCARCARGNNLIDNHALNAQFALELAPGCHGAAGHASRYRCQWKLGSAMPVRDCVPRSQCTGVRDPRRGEQLSIGWWQLAYLRRPCRRGR